MNLKNSLQLTLLFLAFLICNACNKNKIVGNGYPTTEIVEVSDFKEIIFSGNYKIEIDTSQTPKIEVFCDENVFSFIKIRVKDSILSISNFKNTEFETKEPVIIKISNSFLEKITVNGYIVGDLKNIFKNNFIVITNGSSELNMFGKILTTNLITNGSAEINAHKLITNIANVETSGSCELKISDIQKLNLEISGSAKIQYSGNPEIKQENSGSLELIKK